MGSGPVPERTYEQQMAPIDPEDRGEDVFLDVPELHLDVLELEVEDLQARVSLQADVLSLLRLHVGIDAALGRVRLNIRGVDAQALLKVRLDKVAQILERVLSTIDANPQIVEELARSAGAALREAGAGAREALTETGRGVGQALPPVTEGLGRGVGQTIEQVGQGLGPAAGQAGRLVGEAAGQAGRAVGEAAGQAGRGVTEAAGQAGRGVTEAAGQAGQGEGEGAQPGAGWAGPPTGQAGRGAGRAARPGVREMAQRREWRAEASPEEGTGGEPSLEASAAVDAESWHADERPSRQQPPEPRNGQPPQAGERPRRRGLPRRGRRQW
ncbi:MAG TPA: hypothetical protein VHN18_01735 [Micromonosporaceae bacterium]|nr:hypothetical protein [Micromonosporaceae bacterium]